MTEDRIKLLNLFGSGLAGDLEFSVGADAAVAEDHPLAGEILAALNGETASLPYRVNAGFMWATLAPSANDLRGVIEDLRSWILPSFGWEASPSIISRADDANEFSRLLLAASPNGYFRWYSRAHTVQSLMKRLAEMRALIKQAPVHEIRVRPTLEMLRRTFTLGLATNDHGVAAEALDEIDQRQLDTASNALSMRIRLMSRFGDDAGIVSHPQLDDLLSTRVPRRVVESILLAHHATLLSACEGANDLDAALASYRPYHDRLAGLADELEPDADIQIIRMAAYDALVAKDWLRLERLAVGSPTDPVVDGLAVWAPSPPATDIDDSVAVIPTETLPIGTAPNAQTVKPDASQESAVLDWADVADCVRQGASTRLEAFLQQVMQSPDKHDPGEGDFLVELFTDPLITKDALKAADADQVLMATIDGFVCEDMFPRRSRLPLYQSILDVWSESRSMSTAPIDGQMLFTLGDALLRLDGSYEKSVASALGGWWQVRPVRSRLTWLSEALDLLTDQSVAQDYLSLWYSGATLIKADRADLPAGDLRLWHRLGCRLGLEKTVVDTALGGIEDLLKPSADPLLSAGLKKIAIVSLHERPALAAAAQIRSRTDANVIVVGDHAAGEGTASAATADVILFVWGATKHAVYRAFDKVRDRLEYVQGTGAESIVRALERRVAQDG